MMLQVAFLRRRRVLSLRRVGILGRLDLGRSVVGPVVVPVVVPVVGCVEFVGLDGCADFEFVVDQDFESSLELGTAGLTSWVEPVGHLVAYSHRSDYRYLDKFGTECYHCL